MATKNSGQPGVSSGTSIVGGSGGGNLLPRSVAQDWWKAATAQSIIPTLSKSTPVIIGDNIVPVLTKRPSASIIGELQNKKDSELEAGAKVFRTIKAQVGLEFSMETVLTNPAGILDIIGEEMSGALARQVDAAIIHKRQSSDGATLTSGVEAITDTANVLELDPTPGADPDDLLWQGYNKVVDEGGNNFTGFAVDPRLTYVLATARDADGRRLNPDINMGAQVTSYSGQPMVNSKTVGGDVDAGTDTGIRAIGGDWDSLRFGYAHQIGLRKIEYGDPFGNGDLQRRNAVAYLAEVLFGWTIMDLDAFVLYRLPEEPVVP
ncbi:major capsid protein [Gordonia phage Lauer]|uniref:Major capsid protein n=1 Tax=Gordonia phage Lauer TaxID=2656538 RepID=A0A649VIC0_9CAUD|nr:major capsid protein [Gordonia phage Lauer]QGJ92116.1 major capsid protein [Gordonia phage Lauer]